MSEKEIIDLTKQLVHAITHSDWQTYTELCAEDLTAFETDLRSQEVQIQSDWQKLRDRSGCV